MNALEVLQVEILQVLSQIPGSLKVVDVFPVLQGLPSVGVYDGDLARLGEPLGLPLDHALVDPLFDDLVTDVVSPIYVESSLVGSKSDRKRVALNKD